MTRRRFANQPAELAWDNPTPVCTTRELLDVTRLRELVGEPSIDLGAGLAHTYSGFHSEVASGSETLRGFDRAAAPR